MSNCPNCQLPYATNFVLRYGRDCVCHLHPENIKEADRILKTGKYSYVEIYLREDTAAHGPNGAGQAVVKGIDNPAFSLEKARSARAQQKDITISSSQTGGAYAQKDKVPGEGDRTPDQEGAHHSESNTMKRALDSAIDTISRKAAEVTLQMDAQLKETHHHADKAVALAKERLKRRLILEKQTLHDGVGAMEAGDVREMTLIKDHISETILKMECEVNHIVSMMAALVDVPVEEVADWRAEQKLEVGDLKTVFRQLESKIQDCQNNRQPPPSMPLRRSLDDNSYQPKSSVPPNTPHRPRRNLNNDFARMDQSMGSDIQERDENRASRGRH